MDRFEAYLDARLEDWTNAKRATIQYAALTVVLLLFADDIALVARSMPML